MTDPVRCDWPRLIAELEAKLGPHTVCKMLPCQWIQLRRWKAGAEPKYLQGKRLIDLHAQYVPHETLHL